MCVDLAAQVKPQHDSVVTKMSILSQMFRFSITLLQRHSNSQADQSVKKIVILSICLISFSTVSMSVTLLMVTTREKHSDCLIHQTQGVC